MSYDDITINGTNTSLRYEMAQFLLMNISVCKSIQKTFNNFAQNMLGGIGGGIIFKKKSN